MHIYFLLFFIVMIYWHFFFYRLALTVFLCVERMLSDSFYLVFVTAIVLSHRVETQVTFDGACPKLDVVGDFDLHRVCAINSRPI